MVRRASRGSGMSVEQGRHCIGWERVGVNCEKLCM